MLILVGYRGEKMVRNIKTFKNNLDVNAYVNANQEKLLQQFNNLKVEECTDLGNIVTGVYVLRLTYINLENEDQIELCDPEVKESEETDVVRQYYKRGV